MTAGEVTSAPGPTAPLVSIDWLAAHLDAPLVRVVDLRWSLAGPSHAEKFAAGHLPGAAFVDFERELSRKPGAGRHPLCSVADFAALLARLGVSPEVHVVVYDDGTGSVAARLWFMLLLHGHLRASVLDGGFAAWVAAGKSVTTAPTHLTPAPLRVLSRDESQLIDRAQVAALLAQRHGPGPHALVLDARAPERYRGEVEPVDPRAGHIPGAVNAPFAANLIDGRFFKAPAALRAHYEALGVAGASEVVASCGSGVTACHDLLAMRLAGLPPARLYVGSWSDWSAQPDAPVATGSDPG